MTEKPDRCCLSRTSPPSAGLKKWVPTRRSRIRRVLATITAGIAMMTTNEVTSIDHTNSGMRSSDMPGARCLRTVTTISTETASAETSVKVIIWAQMSARLPGAYCGPESGT